MECTVLATAELQANPAATSSLLHASKRSAHQIKAWSSGSRYGGDRPRQMTVALLQIRYEMACIIVALHSFGRPPGGARLSQQPARSHAAGCGSATPHHCSARICWVCCAGAASAAVATLPQGRWAAAMAAAVCRRFVTRSARTASRPRPRGCCRLTAAHGAPCAG